MAVVGTADLFGMSGAELDQLFGASPAGPIPNGAAKGMAIIAPGTPFCAEIADIINIFAWQGKTFDAQHGVLTNKLLPIGLNAIVAEVYQGPSWYDQKDCIVLDYSKTSLLAHWIRDEIRLIAPSLYLGRVYWDQTPLIHFSLQFE